VRVSVCAVLLSSLVASGGVFVASGVVFVVCLEIDFVVAVLSMFIICLAWEWGKTNRSRRDNASRILNIEIC
jgi:hypothetical protein